MKYPLFFFLISFGFLACSQQIKPDNRYEESVIQSTPADDQNRRSVKPDTVIERSAFKNYVFVLDGEAIDQEELSRYAGASLHTVFPYDTTLQGRDYSGAVLFHTPQSALPEPYADDPAYFVNGIQVSPYDIRWSIPESYNKLEKSTKDTVIDGMRYHGSVHVDTDEDFFADRITFAEAVEKYTDLPLQDVIVHWHSGSKKDGGRIIQDHFSIYHIKPSGIRAVAIDSVRFAHHEKFVVHIADHGYRRSDLIDKEGRVRTNRWTSDKAQLLFENPLEIDTACPCYVANFVRNGDDVFQLTELKPEPYGGDALYLEKLSRLLGLPGKAANPAARDSMRVQFIVTRTGMLAELQAIGSPSPTDGKILQAIKRYSCSWSRGMFSGRPVLTQRNMTIIYSKDPNGNIVSLDDLEYRYDE
ncbi:hypothetical protein [Parapedobacter sp.]